MEWYKEELWKILDELVNKKYLEYKLKTSIFIIGL